MRCADGSPSGSPGGGGDPMARRAVVDAIGQAWRDPRAAMAAEIGRGLSEPRVLVQLLLACVLLFVASLPNAVREARALSVDDAVGAAVSAHLFGYIALLPLGAYAIAALAHLASRAFGGRGSFLSARAALFWSALVVAPVALALALLGVGVEIGGVAGLLPVVALLRFAALAFWLWIFAASLAEAEGFSATVRVAAVVIAAFAGVAGLLALVAGGTVA